jgi:hypothetical protein
VLAVFALTGGLLLYGGARDARARHLGAVLLAVGNMFANPLILELSRQLGDPWRAVALALRAMPVEAFAPALLWLFVRAFPTAPTSPRLERFFRRSLMTCAAVGAVLFVANAAAPLIDAPLPPWMRLLDRNSSGTSYFWLLIFMMSVPTLAVMLRQARRAEAAERDKVRVFVLGIVSGFVPGLLVLLLANRWSPLRPVLVQRFWLVGALLYSGLALVPVITAYAVLVERVVRVELVVRNSLRFVLARASLAFLTLAPVSALALHVYRNRNGTVQDVVADTTFVTLAAATGFVLALTRARDRLLRAIDRRLFREGQPLDLVLSQLGERIARSAGLNDVARGVVDAVEASLHPERSFVLVTDRAREQLVPVGYATRPLGRETWLVAALERSREPVIVDLEEEAGVGRLLPSEDQEWLADSGAVALAPLMASDGSLIGLIGVGAKKSTLPFAPSDVGFLTATAAAAAPALEARLLRAAGAAVDAVPMINWRDEPGMECQECGGVLEDATASRCACGGTLRSMALPAVLSGKFRLEGRLGAGGMGVVYRARDLSLNRTVAIKTLPRILPAAAQRLRYEAQAMAAVSHPSLAVIYGAETWKAVPVLIVEFFEGGTLSDRLRRGPMPEAEAIALGITLAQALERVHAAGMLHRDVKPSNVAFTRDGAPKLLDFGLARLVERGDEPDAYDSGESGVLSDRRPSTAATTSQLAGTPLYLSPEAVRGQAPDPSFDLWALGVLLLEAIAGRHPWAGLSTDEVLARVGREGFSRIERMDLPCSSSMHLFFASALSPDVHRRWQTSGDFARALMAMTVSH